MGRYRKKPVAIAATALAIALGWAWWESTRPVQWKGGWL